MKEFIPGIELAGKFYKEAVRPILESDFSGVPYSAALLGAGSEALGFDTEMSTDHQYAPYPKWFGTAFARLICAETLSPSLCRAQFAETWIEREQGLTEAYQLVAGMHNALEITDPLPANVRDFFGRPFKVIALQGFAEALCGRITDPKVQSIARRHLIGGIDMISDNTDILSNPNWRPILRSLFT